MPSTATRKAFLLLFCIKYKCFKLIVKVNKMLNLLFVFSLALKTVLTVQKKHALRLRNLRPTWSQEQLIALCYGIMLKAIFWNTSQIYFIAWAQTLEFYILSSKEYNNLKCLSAGYDCLRWPMILVCLDHPNSLRQNYWPWARGWLKFIFKKTWLMGERW